MFDMRASKPRFELVRFLMEPAGYEFDEEHNANIKQANLPWINQILCTLTTSTRFDRETALRLANL